MSAPTMIRIPLPKAEGGDDMFINAPWPLAQGTWEYVQNVLQVMSPALVGPDEQDPSDYWVI